MTTDQPTPPSSLEEARKRLYDAARDYGSMDYDASKVRREIGEAFIRGAEWARAEVIREVEAYWRAYDERFQSPTAWDRLQTAEARLRALSQGEEGKA